MLNRPNANFEMLCHIRITRKIQKESAAQKRPIQKRNCVESKASVITARSSEEKKKRNWI